MENCTTDISSVQNNSEVHFLQQVKECQDHLQYIEKLFFDLKKNSDNEQFQKLQTPESQYESNQSKCKKKDELNSNSFSDIYLFIQDSESKAKVKNNLYIKKSSKSQNKVPRKTNTQVNSENINNILSPLTVVVQVPNSIINYLKKNVNNNYLRDTSNQNKKKELLKKSKKIRSMSLLQRLFQKKKNLSSTDVKISEKTEILQFVKEKNKNNFINFDQNSNKNNSKSLGLNNNKSKENIISEHLTNAEIGSASNDTKQNQTLIFPITYTFDEKSCMTVKPNVIIHHEIIPQTNSNAWSHCIKITNEVSIQSLNNLKTIEKEDESIKIINQMPTKYLNTSCITEKKNKFKEKKKMKRTKKDFQPSEELLENLFKTLFKTAEKLNNLDELKIFLENLNEKELKLKTKQNLKQNNKTVKIKHNKSKTLNLLLQHVMINTENKTNYSKSLEKNNRIPKKQSSKLSVCSSLTSLSSVEDVSRSPIIVKPKYIQKRRKCHPQSVLNYLVCQSGRDNDNKK